MEDKPEDQVDFVIQTDSTIHALMKTLNTLGSSSYNTNQQRVRARLEITGPDAQRRRMGRFVSKSSEHSDDETSFTGRVLEAGMITESVLNHLQPGEILEFQFRQSDGDVPVKRNYGVFLKNIGTKLHFLSVIPDAKLVYPNRRQFNDIGITPDDESSETFCTAHRTGMIINGAGSVGEIVVRLGFNLLDKNANEVFSEAREVFEAQV